MRRRFLSIDLKFPTLMAGIVLLAGAVFAWVAYAGISGVLYDAAGQRLRTSAAMVAGMIAESSASGRAALLALSRDPRIRRFLRSRSEDSTAVIKAVQEDLPGATDSSLVLVRLVDAEGHVRLEHRFRSDPLAPSWAQAEADQLNLSRTELSLSPLLAAGDVPQYEIAIPVHAEADGESFVGHVILTRIVRGRGVDAIRRLMGTGTLLFGAREAGVWSDLERVVEAPPPIRSFDTPIQFSGAARGAGIGVAQPIRGTPWAVWVELEHAQVVAPARAFAWRMVPVVPVIAAIGALFAWLFSRRITNRIVRLTDEVGRQGADATPDAPRTVIGSGRDEVDRLEESYRVMLARTRRQHELEGQLLQSQKLEAVGRLAGGLAHDFNNVLTVVRNYGELVRDSLPDGSEGARDMEQIMGATDRAARLTRQLLAFSRQQILQPVNVDLNQTIRESNVMLSRLLPTQVSISHHLDERIPVVFADPVQIEQVLINLALNASDAMPQGGKLIFRTALEHLSDARKQVRLVVQDTGVGMDRATIARVFDPFFTTKAPGKGTGLGLASVHGIITQLGGRIMVESEVGRGSAFNILLPAADGEPEVREITPTRSRAGRAEGRVLLVEDDALTREVTRRILVQHGYDVLEVNDGAAAIGRLERDGDSFTLVVTDVMMPGMNGVELADRLGERWPHLPVLLVSGYSDAEVQQRTTGGRPRALVEKPFTAASLLRAAERAIRAAQRLTPR